MAPSEFSKQDLDITAIKPEQWEALETLRRDSFFHTEQLIEEIRRCRIPVQYRIAQQHLGQHIDRVGSAIGEAKRRIAQAKREQRRLYGRNVMAESPELKEVMQEIQTATLDARAYSSFAHQYRLLGDALAWQIYNFHALPIYDWGLNQGAGVSTGELHEGARAELETIEQLWNDEGAFALRHDYTNCLRVGDLSVLYPDSAGLPSIREVKVAGRSTLSHQKEMHRRGFALIEDGEYKASRKEWYIQQTISSQKSTTDLLFQAIAQARKESVGQATNPYLAITVMDETNPAGRHRDDLKKAWAKFTEDIIPPEMWPTLCDHYLHHTSYQKNTTLGFSAPYTIYPLPPDYVAGLVTGYLMVHYRLNTTAITRAFQDAGLNARCKLGDWQTMGGEPPRRTPSPCFIVGKGAWMIPLSGASVEQILCDGLLLEDLVTSFVELCQSRDLNEETLKELERLLVMFTYTGMEDTWRSSLTCTEAAENEEEVSSNEKI